MRVLEVYLNVYQRQNGEYQGVGSSPQLKGEFAITALRQTALEAFLELTASARDKVSQIDRPEWNPVVGED